jgi:hypothetical protein
LSEAPYIEIALVVADHRYVARLARDASAETIQSAIKLLTDWLERHPEKAKLIANGVAVGV